MRAMKRRPNRRRRGGRRGHPRRRRVLAVSLAALAAGAVAAVVIFRAVTGGPQPAPEQPVAATPAALFRPDDLRIVERGREVYATSCAQCHGADLEGQADWRQRGADGLLPAPPHDETGHTWHHTDQVLFDLTKYGMQRFAGPDYRSAMPAYLGVLSDEDIIAAMSYVKSRWPESIRRQHDALNAQRAGG